MSEYFLADHRAAERAKQRERERQAKEQPKAENVKVTLLGDFMFPSSEPQGCDPYNSAQGKSFAQPWQLRRDRR